MKHKVAIRTKNIVLVYLFMNLNNTTTDHQPALRVPTLRLNVPDKFIRICIKTCFLRKSSESSQELVN